MLQSARMIRTSAVRSFEPLDVHEARKRRRRKEADPQQNALIRQGHVFDNIPMELKNKATFEEAIG